MSLWAERLIWAGFGFMIGFFVGVGITLIGPG